MSMLHFRSWPEGEVAGVCEHVRKRGLSGLVVLATSLSVDDPEGDIVPIAAISIGQYLGLHTLRLGAPNDI